MLKCEIGIPIPLSIKEKNPKTKQNCASRNPVFFCQSFLGLFQLAEIFLCSFALLSFDALSPALAGAAVTHFLSGKMSCYLSC